MGPSDGIKKVFCPALAAFPRYVVYYDLGVCFGVLTVHFFVAFFCEGLPDRKRAVVDIDGMLNQQGAWLRAEGPESDIVISSRIRLARNLAGYPFISRMSEQDRKTVQRSFRDVMEKILPAESFFFLDMEDLSISDRRYLLERQLVSPEFVEQTESRAVLIDRDEDFSVMVNEEDHLRIQALTSGFDFQKVWDRVNRLDDLLEHEIPMAFDERLGYLTACPSNIGTGIRASVMVHLPCLCAADEFERANRALQKSNLAVRGMYGEGSSALGEFYQVSNQATLGVAEEELIAHLEGFIPRLIEYERKSREFLLTRQKERLMDRCYRAIGILARARKIEMEEAMEHLSSVRLGFHLGLQNEISIAKINDLLLHLQPAHLQKLAGRTLDGDAENVFRAEYLREQLA